MSNPLQLTMLLPTVFTNANVFTKAHSSDDANVFTKAHSSDDANVFTKTHSSDSSDDDYTI
jgi:hypothetical protein